MDPLIKHLYGEAALNWKNRGDRIARMQERDQFDRFFMPLVYLVAILGLVILIWQGIDWLDANQEKRESVALGAMLFCAPVPVWLFRALRGHYSSKCKD